MSGMPAHSYSGNWRTPFAAPEKDTRLSSQARRRLRADAVGRGVAGQVRSGIQEIARTDPVSAGGTKALDTAGATGSRARTTLLDGMDHPKPARYAPACPTTAERT